MAATTSKVVPIATPKSAPVVAVKVAVVTDHPAVTICAAGGMQVKTLTGVMPVNVGDYVVPDGQGGFKVVPPAFYQLFYQVVG